MKLFLPAANDAAQAEQAYEGIRKFNADEMGATLSPRRIYKVGGVHNGKRFEATVGQPFESFREPVITILLDTSRKCYFICTPNRGVLRGMPYLSGSNEIDSVEDFEASESTTQSEVVN
jgi:hypothetical protein